MKIKIPRVLYLILLVIFAVIAVVVINRVTESRHADAVARMNSAQAIADYTRGKAHLVLTVGVMDQGKTDYRVYGPGGADLPHEAQVYEIGSLTKTFTTALLAKAVDEGKVSLSDSMDKYLPLESRQYYPTLQQLATHTAGYGEYPSSLMMRDVANALLLHHNPFNGYTKQDMLGDVQKKHLSGKTESWAYSNFGMSALGDVLARVEQSDYQTLVEGYIRQDLGLAHTQVGLRHAALNGYTQNGQVSNWVWQPDDAFLPAGSLVSTVDDLFQYASIQMSGEKPYLALTHQRYADTPIPEYGMGLGWIVGKDNHIIWHNGGTGGFNCFLGFDQQKHIAVVVLANYASQPDNNATLIGLKLLQELQKGQNLIFGD